MPKRAIDITPHPSFYNGALEWAGARTRVSKAEDGSVEFEGPPEELISRFADVFNALVRVWVEAGMPQPPQRG